MFLLDHSTFMEKTAALRRADAMGRFMARKLASDLRGGVGEHRAPSDFDRAALREGQLVEREHTNKPHVARRIAMDHLTEDPQYYAKLRTMVEDKPDPAVEKAKEAGALLASLGMQKTARPGVTLPGIKQVGALAGSLFKPKAIQAATQATRIPLQSLKATQAARPVAQATTAATGRVLPRGQQAAAVARPAAPAAKPTVAPGPAAPGKVPPGPMQPAGNAAPGPAAPVTPAPAGPGQAAWGGQHAPAVPAQNLPAHWNPMTAQGRASQVAATPPGNILDRLPEHKAPPTFNKVEQDFFAQGEKMDAAHLKAHQAATPGQVAPGPVANENVGKGTTPPSTTPPSSPAGAAPAQTPGSPQSDRIKVPWGKALGLGAVGLGAYGLMKGVPYAAKTMEQANSMPLGYGGGWSPVPYGYGYSPYSAGTPNMGAGA